MQREEEHEGVGTPGRARARPQSCHHRLAGAAALRARAGPFLTGVATAALAQELLVAGTSLLVVLSLSTSL